MLATDTRIIARQSTQAGGLEVLPTRHEVMFSDGGAVHLHLLRRNCLPVPLRRALATGDGRLYLLDLPALLPDQAEQIALLPFAEQPRALFMALRGTFSTAAAFCAAAVSASLGRWLPVGNAGYTWQPAPIPLAAAVPTSPTTPRDHWSTEA